jgi:hypothetical protein
MQTAKVPGNIVRPGDWLMFDGELVRVLLKEDDGTWSCRPLTGGRSTSGPTRTSR